MKVYIGFFRRFKVLLALGLLALGYMPCGWAQQGDDFWFDVPEINRPHGKDFFDCYLNISTLDHDVRVHIDLPAEEDDFTELVFTMKSGSTKRIQLTRHSGNVVSSNGTGADESLSLFYKPEIKASYLASCPEKDRGKFIENLLCWSKSDTTDPDRLIINQTNKGVHMWAEVMDTVWNRPALPKLMDYRREEINRVNIQYKDASPNPAGNAQWKAYQDALMDVENRVRRYRRENFDPTTGTTITDPNERYWTAIPYKFRPGNPNVPLNLLTSYVEIATDWNMELIALKAANAIGKAGDRFYVPMQTDLKSDYFDWMARPYCSITVTAAKPNTLITVVTPNTLFVKKTGVGIYGGGGANQGELQGTVPTSGPYQGKHVYKIFFEKAGQSSILVPYRPNSHYNWNCYQNENRASLKRLQGSIVEVVQGEVVVLSRDDLAVTPNQDAVEDQMVPLKLLGRYYSVVQGVVGNYRDEFIYIVGTKDGTTVKVSGRPAFQIDEGEQKSIRIAETTDKGVSIAADEKIAVLHMSGIEGASKQSQRGGAILPALPENPKNQCIGSKAVTFKRTQPTPKYFCYLNLVAWAETTTAETPTGPVAINVQSAIGNFKLQKPDADGVYRDVY
ncbi:MAG: hypothetical protein CSA97_04060, partial [Bacteroidetes bacterium]